MKTNKLLAGLLVTAVTVSWISFSFADDATDSIVDNVKEMKHNWVKSLAKSLKGDRKMDMNLTDEEKTAIEAMSDEERNEYFESKKSEREALKNAKENVIDKLLAWDTLTSDEELIRAELIETRAEKKAEMEARKVERDEIKTIIQKKKAWEELTSDEEAKISDIKSEMRWDKKWWDKGFKGWKRGMNK